MLKRLEYLIDNTGNELSKKLLKENILLDSEQAIIAFSKSDPTRNKSNTQWLIKTYMNNGFLFEDIEGEETSKVYETLDLFKNHKDKISNELRSLNVYKTLAEVWRAIEEFIPRNISIEKLCCEAVKQNGIALHDVPSEHRDKELLSFISKELPVNYNDFLNSLKSSLLNVENTLNKYC